MARTEGHWEKKVGGYIRTIAGTPGILLQGLSRYINFGSTFGESGYGIRDNAGVIEIKDSGGSWNPIGQAELAATFETVNKNLAASNVISSTVDSMTYANGIVKTLDTSTSGTVIVTLSGSTPAGIDLIKTITLGSGVLPTFVYST